MFEQAQVPERRNVYLDWLLRGAAGVVFIVFGAEKFGDHAEWVQIFQQIGLGQWFRYFTGVVEILGGLLVLAPWTVNAGLALLGCTMAGAMIAVTFVLGQPLFAIFPGMFLAGLAAIWYYRRDFS